MKKAKINWAWILSALLLAAVIIGFVPQMGLPAYAVSGNRPMIAYSESVLKKDANTDYKKAPGITPGA